MGIRKIKNYSVGMEPPVMDEARTFLQLGQRLSPIINDLLKRWVEAKRKEKKKNE